MSEGSATERYPAGTSRRRFLTTFALAGGALVTTSVGLVSSRYIRSPAQAVADTAPPTLSVLTAEVEQRILRDTVILRGRIGAAKTVEVTPSPRETERMLVTSIRVKAGQKIAPATVLLEVSGRPLFAMPGQIPSYRDLRPGNTGRDVRQLQRALLDCGHRGVTVTGTFDSRTKDAVTSLYEKLGYEAPTTGPSSQRELTDAWAAVRRAERALSEAQLSLAEAKKAAETATAQSGPASEREAEQGVRLAKDELAVARSAFTEVERVTGSMIPLSEVIFLPSFPARVEKLNAVVGGEVKAPLLTVSSGALVATAWLNPAQRDLLAQKMPALIMSEMLGLSARGVISSIGELGVNQDGERGYLITVAAAGQPFDHQLAGADVRLTVEVAATHDKVLVVPLTAVYAGADGQVAVVRVIDGLKQERVQVTPGATGDGYVAVTPARPRTLVPGDRVVVGSRRPS